MTPEIFAPNVKKFSVLSIPRIVSRMGNWLRKKRHPSGETMESRSWRRSKWMKTSKTSGWEQDKSRSMTVKLLRTLRITLFLSLCYLLHSDRSKFHGSLFPGILKLVNLSKMCFVLKINYTGGLQIQILNISFISCFR